MKMFPFSCFWLEYFESVKQTNKFFENNEIKKIQERLRSEST